MQTFGHQVVHLMMTSSEFRVRLSLLLDGMNEFKGPPYTSGYFCLINRSEKRWKALRVKRDGSRWKGNVRLLSMRGNVSGSGVVGVFFLVLGVIPLLLVILGAFPASSKCQRSNVAVHKHTACAGSSKTERLFILTSTSGTSK